MLKKTIALLSLIAFGQISAQEQFTIAWDTSLSMEERAVDLEFRYLNNFFSEHPDTRVQLITFNNVSYSSKEFITSNGNWSAIKEVLASVTYDGATSYNNIAQFIEKENSLIFSDGHITAKSLPITTNKELSIVSSSKDEPKGISRLTRADNIKFIQLTEANTKNFVSNKRTYKGSVFVEDEDLKTIKIYLKETDTEIKIKEDGTYQFSATPGETVVFRTASSIKKEVTLTQSSNLNVWIKSSGIALDQVNLNNKVAPAKIEAVNTGYKKVNKSSLGYAVKTISNKDINKNIGDVSNAINGKVAGVNQGYGKDISTAKIRQANSELWARDPLVLIDGAPVPRSVSGPSAGIKPELTSFIDVNNVADITILKGFAATNQYGTEGSGGVILITTKQAYNSNPNSDKPVNDKRNKNVYSGNILPNNIAVKSSYIKELEKETTIEKAYKKYLSQRAVNASRPMYFTDVYRFFRPSNLDLATRVAYNNIELANTSQAALRGLLFEANKNKDYDLALATAQDLMKKFPKNIQSYLDLAISYKNSGDYQKALDLLLGIERGTINQNLDFSNLQKLADNEIRALVSERKEELELSKIDVKHLKKTKLDARIVFDWSNPNAEFELQFVNPKKLFFTWDHNLKNPARLEQEFVHGFSQEEFEIDGGDKGQWLINVKYLGNRVKSDRAHTLLKCTIYYDYGTPKERVEEKIIRLHEINQEQQVVNLMIR